MTKDLAKWYWASAYVLSIFIANVLVSYFGIVKMFGLMFPAGALMIGLTFSFRDFVQRYWGPWKTWFFIGISAVITLFMNWQIALASVAAFLISEFTDWLVFIITKKKFIHRIWISNLFSTPLDSAIFVIIAFGWNFDAIFGQTIVKYISGLLVIPFIIRYNKIKPNDTVI